MSKDLDKKLEQLLKAHRMPAEVIHDFSMQDTRAIDNIADAVQQIKDCFITDGWVDAKINNTDNPFYLTGGEWYVRFEPLLEEIDLNSPTRYREIKEAAKRASGVKQ